MRLSEYQRIKLKIEGTYQQELSALNLLWRKYGDPSQKSTEGSGENRNPGSLKNLIREAIVAQSGDFSINDLEAWIKEKKPEVNLKRATLRVILTRFTGKQIQVMKVGQGRSPNIYRAV